MNKDEESYNYKISDDKQTFILTSKEISHWWSCFYFCLNEHMNLINNYSSIPYRQKKFESKHLQICHFHS